MQFFGPEQGRDSHYVPSLQISSYEAERLVPVSLLPPVEGEFVPHGPSAQEIIGYAVSIDRPTISLRRLHTRILLAAHKRYLDTFSQHARYDELAEFYANAQIAPSLQSFVENQKRQTPPEDTVQEAQAVIRGIERVAARPELLLRQRVFSD